MEDLLIMSKKERSRKALVESVQQGYLTLREASERIEVSYRQMKRIWSRYRTDGDEGLVHRSRGKRSSRALSSTLKAAVVERYRSRYEGFGPTLAHEKLVEEGYQLSVESLRKLLIESGCWVRHRKRSVHRRRRERRGRFGEMVQIDGSIHDWFETGKHLCLLNMVDDATGVTFSQLDKGETTHVLLRCLYSWIERYGVPDSVYVDLKSVYISSGNLYGESEDDEQRRTFLSIFERVCKRLHIKVIKAYSAQAKGRVERNHGVYQDRFVKELRLCGIKRISEANKFLLSGYLDKINEKFSKPPRDSEDAHRAASSYGDLKQIFCWEYERQVRNDMTIQFEKRHYQLEPKMHSNLRPKLKIQVRRHLDGSLSICYKDKVLSYREIESHTRPQKETQPSSGYSGHARSIGAKKNRWKSPWSQYNPDWLTTVKRSEV